MRKKRILFCTEATFLNTGYATYSREILNYLMDTGKYEIAELSSYGSIDDPRSASIAWKYYPAALPKNASEQEKQRYNAQYTNQFGEYYFHDACLDFQPDIVCDIRDFWMMEFQERSPYRNFYKWCIMPTVDAEPQAHQWIEAYKSADACLTYSDWAGELLKKQSYNSINFIGSAPPSAHPAYSVEKDKLECRMSMKIPEDKKILGTVMRNQRRKLYPDLFKTFRMLLDRVEDPDNYLLYCHTSYPDMGWDIPQLLQEYKLSSYVMFTYVCKKTSKPFASHFQGPRAISPFTDQLDAVMSNVQNGITYDNLSTIMNCFDLYIQYANSEGFGLPQVEAAAGGVPVASIDYSAMSSVIRKLDGIVLDTKAVYKEMETGCLRAVPDNELACEKIIDFLSKPAPIRKKAGFNTKQNFLKHYQWDKSGSVWEKYFDSVEVMPEELTWRSPLRIAEPHGMVDPKSFPTTEHMSHFLITNVLCQPERLNSYFHKKLQRDLVYGFSTSATAGTYSNDSSMVSDGNLQKSAFNYEVAYKYLSQIRNLQNMLERKRGTKLGIQ